MKPPKEATMFSDTLEELRFCYERMNFPLETVCSSVVADHESVRRAKLIKLCAKIAAEYGHELESWRIPLD